MIRLTNIGSDLLKIDHYGQASVQDMGPGSGIVRYNTNTQRLEVFDGSGSWYPLYQDINIGLSDRVEKLLRWADTKYKEEQELDRLCAEYPNLDVARQEFEILRRLVSDPKPSIKDNF